MDNNTQPWDRIVVHLKRLYLVQDVMTHFESEQFYELLAVMMEWIATHL